VISDTSMSFGIGIGMGNAMVLSYIGCGMRTGLKRPLVHPKHVQLLTRDSLKIGIMK
jgi:hypothetical protein